MNELARETINDIRAAAETTETVEGHRKVRIDLNQKVPQIMVNADRIKTGQVLSNLLSNAIKFSPPGGKIQVSTDVEERNGQSLTVVTAEDEGPGIDKEIMPKLFTKFARKSGTGLGLCIEVLR